MHLLLRRLNIKQQTQHFIRAKSTVDALSDDETVQPLRYCEYTATPVTPIFFPFLHPQPF